MHDIVCPRGNKAFKVDKARHADILTRVVELRGRAADGDRGSAIW